MRIAVFLLLLPFVLGNHDDFHQFHTKYYPLEEVHEILTKISVAYPVSTERFSLGQTVNGNEMMALRISKPDNEIVSKPVLFIHSAIHAREWTTVNAALFIIGELVTRHHYDSLLESVDVVIMPVANPDGYEVTWRRDHRMHRKNVGKKFEDDARYDHCDGVDLNRNFPTGYKVTTTAAELSKYNDKCSETYAGNNSLSENESQAIAKFLREENVQGYFDLHAHGNVIIYPFTYETNEKPENIEELKALTESMNDAIFDVNRRTYRVGSSKDVYGYYAAGATIDYAVAEAGVRYAFTIELGDDFEQPLEKMEGVLHECWRAVLTLLRTIAHQ